MRFGILAHSSEGAALCFLTFCREGFREIGRHMHPDVMLDCAAMGHVMPAWEADDHGAVRAFLAQSVERLAAGGCDFFACPDNTAHISLELPGPDLALPGLNIAGRSRGACCGPWNEKSCGAWDTLHHGGAGLSPRPARGRD